MENGRPKNTQKFPGFRQTSLAPRSARRSRARRGWAVAATMLTASMTLAACGGSDAAEGNKNAPITFAGYGGDVQAAFIKAWGEPFSEHTGIKLQEDGPTDYAKVQQQVMANQVTWDVVHTEDFWAEAQCGKLLLPLNTDIIDMSAIDPDLVTNECGAPIIQQGYTVAYDTTKYGDAGPANWVDFFDTEKFPGKRAVYNYPVILIEAALLADGVKPDELYPLDVDRAFAKLAKIKDDLVLYDTGAQQQEMLESGEVPIVMAWTGRLGLAMGDGGATYKSDFQQTLRSTDTLVVPKGTKNVDGAMKLIAEALSTEGQQSQSELLYYAPTNLDTDISALPEKKLEFLVTSPEISDDSILGDAKWWATNYADVQERWTSFISG